MVSGKSQRGGAQVHGAGLPAGALDALEDEADSSATTSPDALTPPEGNPRFPALDGLRAFAALAVVVFHAGQFTVSADAFGGWAVSHLDSGVTIFFVLTGFLLYRPFLAAARDQAPPIPMRRFY